MDSIISWIDQWDTVDKIFSFIGLILALISPPIDRFRRRLAENRVGCWARIIGFLFLPFLPFIIIGKYLFKILLIGVVSAIIGLILTICLLPLAGLLSEGSENQDAVCVIVMMSCPVLGFILFRSVIRSEKYKDLEERYYLELPENEWLKPICLFLGMMVSLILYFLVVDLIFSQF